MSKLNKKDVRLKPVQKAADYILARLKDHKPEVALVLGSGLGGLAEGIEDSVTIEYSSIPNFPVSTVPGHAGRIVCGSLGPKTVIVFQGRFHYYEGYSMDEVVFPVRVLTLLGIEQLILTNAAGGINPLFRAGDLMCITDHIKLTGVSPLRGANIDALGPRFNDMSDAYTATLRRIAEDAAVATEIDLRHGVYAYMTGPSFETPAEIRMLRSLGADAVGMSTVPEVIVAAHAGLQVLAISTITNLAAGILDQPLSHEEVMAAGAMVRDKLLALIKGIVSRM